VAAWLLAAGARFAAGCQRAPVTMQESYVFGTRVEVTVAGRPPAEARAAAAAVLAEFDRLHRMLHAWQPSELTALNDAIAAGRPHEVSTELAAILADAQALTLAGERLFDPGIGRLVALWGFHGDEFRPALPEPQALADWLAARPSLADLRLDGTRVASANRAVAVDLGGYAKGYALDRAAGLLRARGVSDALINIGGNVMALGTKNGKAWRVGIRDPRGAGFIAALDLHDGEAIGTSGDYQRYFELGGHRYAHLLDPRSGRPAAGTQAVTVLVGPGAGAGTRSDVWSKPLFVAGKTHFAGLAGRLGATHWLRVGGDGRIAVSAPLAARLAWRDPPPPVVVHVQDASSRAVADVR
jgi:thiamine biosynthesis lipoprotein